MALDDLQNEAEGLSAEELKKVIDEVNHSRKLVEYNGKKYEFVSMVDNQTDYVRLANEKGEPIFIEVGEFFKSLDFELEGNSEIKNKIEKILEISKFKIIEDSIKEIESDKNYHTVEKLILLNSFLEKLKKLGENIVDYEQILPTLEKKVLTNKLNKLMLDGKLNKNNLAGIENLIKYINVLKNYGEDVSVYENFFLN